MFTGRIEDTGRIKVIWDQGGDRRFTLAPGNLSAFSPGESLAVNGACLTVEKSDQGSVTVFVSAETLSVTTLGALQRGDSVNLERAMAVNGRFEGHLVTGHVDGVEKLERFESAGESRRARISLSAEIAPFVVAKGSIALDGVSLTVNACGKDYAEVNLIPQTLKETILSFWRPGQQINVETDLIGKYVLRQHDVSGKGEAGLSREKLERYGF